MPKVVSQQQLIANRRNAQQSTGPTTPDGKAHSARNALKHGIFSPQIVVETGDGAESPEEFQTLLDALIQKFDPQDVIEQALVERVAACFWRLRRAQRFEAGALRKALDESQREDDCGPDQHKLDRLEQELKNARKSREQLADHLQFLQALNLDDPRALDAARPTLEKIQLRHSGDVWQLPVPQMRDVLLRKLPAMIRELHDEDIPKLEQDIKDAERYRHLRRQRRALTAALPAPDDVLKLVRYENMLDRQLHRALTQLNRRRSTDALALVTDHETTPDETP